MKYLYCFLVGFSLILATTCAGTTASGPAAKNGTGNCLGESITTVSTTLVTFLQSIVGVITCMSDSVNNIPVIGGIFGLSGGAVGHMIGAFRAYIEILIGFARSFAGLGGLLGGCAHGSVGGSITVG